MFSGFTKETSEFFWELTFNNERPWFLAHKEQFERCVNQPFRDLAMDTFALMKERCPKFEGNVHIARIYRDARRLFGRGPYKDHLWFSIKDVELLSQGPMFWFQIGASDFSYGMGFYDATPGQMEAFRRSLDANPARFLRLVRSIEKTGRFTIEGEEYKRPKADKGPELNPWYNRRRIGLEHREAFGGVALSPQLPEVLAQAFEQLMPMYQFFMEIYRAAGENAAEK